ncbi:MAG: large-conductance mechanosensitive channel protein MscL [Muribaculaceae bacterium]|jgi:large conductance mechanosensitive channel protein|nr:large-conductance mechanosensitive channel protein MscL [Muribaculaceae bacterium]CCX47460.1 large conductance mechanosensitive channel protein [Bacteroides sp. CAG:927]
MSKFLKDFRDFAMRGNVIDMAVGVIIGAAFGKIVSSLVDDIIMPLVGVATGGINFTDYKWVIQPEVKDAAGEIITPLVSLNWGTWVQTVVNFLIVAFCIFVMIRFMQNLRKKKEEEVAAAPAPAPEPTKEEVLLTEIRDLLKEQQKK